ncbi:MAG: MIP/aquaporin family protein [Candidatus Polarisedimenticolia bacterium]
MIDLMKRHWPEYLIEGSLLGLFMISATLWTVVLEHPASPLRAMLPEPLPRRALMGIAMGATAAALIYSPWGRRSGAHFNPSVTLTFLSLGKVAAGDAFFYVASQFAGGLLGVLLVAALLGMALGHPAVHFAATLPGPSGPAAAFAAEAVISFVLMLAILVVSNTRRLARLTGLCAGILVAAWITLEAPISGMSMNPARSVASALPAGALDGLWIYFTAPTLGMLLAARAYLGLRGARAVACAKLHHDNPTRCIFRCAR